MVNKVILEGILQRSPYITQSQNGSKKALFTLEITTYEEKATTKYIEVEAYGKQADKVEKLDGGETIYVEGKLYAYKSTKYDKWMLAVSCQEVEINTQKQSPVQQVLEPSLPESYYQISDDDLPF